MARPRYTDPHDDPTFDPEDLIYGDYDPDTEDGFYVFDLYAPTEEDLDDE